MPTLKKLKMARNTFTCIDAHTCGNPVRLVVEGGPELFGKTMNEKRLHFIREYDWIRKGLMFEPRGHDMMSGSILYPPHHPDNETIRDVTHMLWTGNTIDSKSSGRNAVFYGNKAIDRSPCGTGTSARLAQLHAKGQLKKGEDYIHESFIGSKFIGRVEKETTLNGRKAIIPSIKGWAKIYGHNTITIDDEDDPYAFGFQVI